MSHQKYNLNKYSTCSSALTNIHSNNNYLQLSLCPLRESTSSLNFILEKPLVIDLNSLPIYSSTSSFSPSLFLPRIGLGEEILVPSMGLGLFGALLACLTVLLEYLEHWGSLATGDLAWEGDLVLAAFLRGGGI